MTEPGPTPLEKSYQSHKNLSRAPLGTRRGIYLDVAAGRDNRNSPVSAGKSGLITQALNMQEPLTGEQFLKKRHGMSGKTLRK